MNDKLKTFIANRNGNWPTQKECLVLDTIDAYTSHGGEVINISIAGIGYISKEEFEACAKRMGYINGYRWGVEYPTNGKKPDLPDTLLVKYQHKSDGEWLNNPFPIGSWAWAETSKAFKIVDEAYKPSDTSHLNEVSEISESKPDAVVVSENPESNWFEAGELPPVGAVVELAEATEFLSLASGVVTLIAKGAHCHVVGHAKRQDNGSTCITLMSVINTDAGFCTGNPDLLIKPIRTERNNFIDAAWNGLRGDMNHTETVNILGQLYDAGFRLPEAKA